MTGPLFLNAARSRAFDSLWWERRRHYRRRYHLINTLIDMLSSAKTTEAGGISTHEVLAKHLGEFGNQVETTEAGRAISPCPAHPMPERHCCHYDRGWCYPSTRRYRGALTYTLKDCAWRSCVTMIVSLTIPAASLAYCELTKSRCTERTAVVNAGFDVNVVLDSYAAGWRVSSLRRLC